MIERVKTVALWNYVGWNRMVRKTKYNLKKLTKTPSKFGLLSTLVAFSPLLPAHTLVLKESDIFGELPSVTSVSRLKQNPHTSPASVSVINQRMIKASGAQTLTDILALAPGFQVFHLNSNRQGANYHSVNNQFPNQLEIMVNGRSVYLPLLSTVLWHTLGLHIDDIDRVEIIRGSNSATQGSNAFLGAVNFITKSPMTDHSWKASAIVGSMNSQSAQLSHSGQFEGTFYRFSGSSETNDGNSRFKDSHERNYINSEWIWSPTINDTVSLNFGVDQGYTHIGYLYDYENRFPNGERYLAKQNYSSNYQHLRWSKVLNNDKTLHVRSYRNLLNLNESKPSIEDITRFITKDEAISVNLLQNNPEFRGYREHGKTSLWDMELAIEIENKTAHSFTGIGIRKEKSSSPVLLQSGEVSSDKFRLFNSSEIHLLPKVIINAGLMHEYENNVINATSGRLGVNYQLLPQTSIRLGYSSSNRLPSLLERNGNYTILPNRILERENQELNPEKIISYELGIHHQLNKLQGSIDIRLFQENISEAIMNFKEGMVGERRNIGQWQNNGFETQIKLQPSNTVWLLFNYSYLNNNVESWNQGSAGIFPDVQLAPRHTLSSLANWEARPDLNLSATYYFMDDVLWRRSYNLLHQPKYERLDIKLAKSWRSKNSQIELSTLVQNAFDNSYQTFYQDHKFDRRIFVQLNITMD
ncbi:TonB-dependent receptor plug domain-containing protein [Nitrincola schmidtii]|uniref:TonB-dependent receptor plug domain-containing protein n=1 Tax=Nitrincola schmidtii TaxID=1730894 RepID=UPI00124E9ACF|nr:TonB-dependent receptor [Nitrincola schmidtii]